jgi:uncharacterized protein YbjT (DUF2867 family)
MDGRVNNPVSTAGPVLVAGAAGQLGRRVTARLLDAGVPVRALVRDPRKLGALAARVDVRVADARDEGSLSGVFDGVSAVFSAVGASVVPSLSAGWRGYHAVDVPANRNLIAAARAAGVPRFVYVSLLVNQATRSCAYVDAHEQVVELLRASDFDWCVLRPTGFHSGILAFLDLAKRGIAPLIGGGEVRTNPIADDDLAAVAVAQLCAAAPFVDRELPLGGPEIMTRRRMVELAFEALGRKPRLLAMPALLGRLLAFFVRPLSPRISDFLRFAVALGEDDLIAPVRGARPLLASYEEAVARR